MIPCATFRSLRFDVAEAVRKRQRPTFEFSENSLNRVPIVVTGHLKSEPNSLQCRLEVFIAIDQKHGGFDILLLP